MKAAPLERPTMVESLQLCKGSRKVTRDAPRKVTQPFWRALKVPGVTEELPNNCLTSAPKAEMWPNVGQLWPMLGRGWPNVGPSWAMCGRCWSNLARVRANMDQFGSELAGVWPKWANVGQKVAQLDQLWSTVARVG